MSTPRYDNDYFRQRLAELMQCAAQELAATLAEMPPTQTRHREDQWRRGVKLADLQESLRAALSGFVT